MGYSIPMNSLLLDRAYPKIITRDFVALGHQARKDPSLPSIVIRDFPLKRKESAWSLFPETLAIHPQEIHPLPPLDLPFSYPPLYQKGESPNLSSWEKNLAAFQKEPFQKVVLAKKTSLLFADTIPFWPLFSYLRKRSPTAFPFGILLSPSVGFISITPEKLFTKKGASFETEAVAGTIQMEREQELLSSSKEVEEFLFVKQFLAKQLQRICKPFSLNKKIFIKRAGNVSHLYYPFTASLKEDMEIEKLIDFLHPTPAIGGLPKKESLDFIATHEPFDRGWYAGTIEITTPMATDVYVAIRSCKIIDKEMEIFTGCGVTKASDPLKEWEELNHKRKLFGEWS